MSCLPRTVARNHVGSIHYSLFFYSSFFKGLISNIMYLSFSVFKNNNQILSTRSINKICRLRHDIKLIKSFYTEALVLYTSQQHTLSIPVFFKACFLSCIYKNTTIQECSLLYYSMPLYLSTIQNKLLINIGDHYNTVSLFKQYKQNLRDHIKISLSFLLYLFLFISVFCDVCYLVIQRVNYREAFYSYLYKIATKICFEALIKCLQSRFNFIILNYTRNLKAYVIKVLEYSPLMGVKETRFYLYNHNTSKSMIAIINVMKYKFNILCEFKKIDDLHGFLTLRKNSSIRVLERYLSGMSTHLILGFKGSFLLANIVYIILYILIYIYYLNYNLLIHASDQIINLWCVLFMVIKYSLFLQSYIFKAQFFFYKRNHLISFSIYYFFIDLMYFYYSMLSFNQNITCLKSKKSGVYFVYKQINCNNVLFSKYDKILLHTNLRKTTVMVIIKKETRLYWYLYNFIRIMKFFIDNYKHKFSIAFRFLEISRLDTYRQVNKEFNIKIFLNYVSVLQTRKIPVFRIQSEFYTINKPVYFKATIRL